uniref:Disintegrin and metalloproteinase domain-containing protein 21-like n=1 Tax=Pogona vitticeps TaxID=103695 RepID=A0A6J0UCD0_9SAUR
MVSGGQDLKNWLVLQLGSYMMLLGLILPNIHSGPFSPPAYTSYEIIIPRQLIARAGKAKKDEVSYIITTAGKDYVIRLKRNAGFVVENLPIFTYEAKERRVESRPHVSTECYHEGYVEGVVDSLVALSNCFGLRGYLQIRDKNYGIEPLQNSSRFQHVLYLIQRVGDLGLEDRKEADKTKVQAEEMERRQRRSPVSAQPHPSLPKYVELYIVVDNAMFLYQKRSPQKVTHLVMDIVNMVDVNFRQLNTQLVLMGLEIWNRGNRINDSDDLATLLRHFNEWRLSSLANLTRHDTAHLFVRRNAGRVFGESFEGAVCNPALSAGVEAYVGDHLVVFSVAVSHELGHHMGLKQDGPNCFCGAYRGCLMSSHHAEVSRFSNCSTHRFLELSLEGALDCLTDVPRNVLVPKRCGNGALDVGEQCDCGGAERCRRDPCCNADCTFKPHALCSSGPCCQDCQFLASGHLCRPETDQCDLPEYCSGRSAWCRPDVYMQDGTPCNNQRSFCYAKRCWDHDALCSQIFGEESTVAPKSCFLELNTAGSPFGNCGRSHAGRTYVKCRPQDVLCGRVHCTGVRSAPTDIKHVKVIRVPIGTAQCWATEYSGKIEHFDIGVVPDGVGCGPRNICLNRSCVSTSFLMSRCDPEEKCGRRGVCNNRHNCHCHADWAPPFCNTRGTGGSIDGGSPLASWTSTFLRRTFGTVIPITVLAIAAIMVFGRACTVLPVLNRVVQWLNSTNTGGTGSVVQPRVRRL